MALTVQQLNADTTFLLTFHSANDYTVLVDPWLTGPSPIWHAAFAVSSHTTDSSIQSLTELDKPPNLVVVSQPKNDHCNRETLCTLPKAWSGTILAVPAAAKKIRSWRYFREEQIRVIPTYNHRKPCPLLRLPLNAPETQQPGPEIMVTNIPEPYDLSAVHNAIAITYNPSRPSKPMNILYAPHGLNPSLLNPYQTHHLHSAPVDLLFHSLNTEANPALLGGVVSNGALSGVEIVEKMKARCWVGAHDEVKENGGIATKLIRCRMYSVEEVEGMLREKGCKGTEVKCLGVGGVLKVGWEEEKPNARERFSEDEVVHEQG